MRFHYAAGFYTPPSRVRGYYHHYHYYYFHWFGWFIGRLSDFDILRERRNIIKELPFARVLRIEGEPRQVVFVKRIELRRRRRRNTSLAVKEVTSYDAYLSYFSLGARGKSGGDANELSNEKSNEKSNDAKSNNQKFHLLRG